MPAEYEVRITPLLLGVPGLLETDAGGITEIDEGDTILVTQYLDDGFEVNVAINEPLTGQIVIPIDEPVVADLEPFEQALWIGYKRPGNTLAEGLIYGPCNVITDYEAGTVTLTVQDPSQRCQHHYVRRGDPILDLTAETGTLRANGQSVDQIIDAARNIDSQQDRNVPALAFSAWEYGDGVPGAPFFQFERGQECWDLIATQILKSDTGPDAYSAPVDSWAFPFTEYSELGLYDRMTDPAAPAVGELGRNLDPADPNTPETGKVLFELGYALDNLVGLVESPVRPATHWHVVDADRKYRVTTADAASSARCGVWVNWVATDFNVVGGDTSVLQAVADAGVKAYGSPPKHFTVTPRPDDVLQYHYGHQFWPLETPGDYQIGDFVRVRAQRGYRSFSTLARITAAKFSIVNGLAQVDLRMIPAVPGSVDEEDS